MAERKGKLARTTEAQLRRVQPGERERRGRPSGKGYDPAREIETHLDSTLHPHAEPTSSTEPEQDELPIKASSSEREITIDPFIMSKKGGYDPAQFYTRSVDEKGHGERLQVRIPQGIDAQLAGAVAKIPHYRSMQDLIRDALVHRLHYLQHSYDIGDDVRRMLELEQMRAKNDMRREEIRALTQTVDEHVAMLDEAVAAQDVSMLQEAIEGCELLTDWLREPYLSKMMKKVNDYRDEMKKMRRGERGGK